MKIHRMIAVTLRHYFLLRSSFIRLVPLFVWVAVDIVLWGFMTRYLNTLAAATVNFVPALLGALVFWGFFTRVMLGVTTAFFEDVWSRNFLNLFATPLSVGEYLAGLVLSAIVTSAVGVAAMLALAIPVFGLSFAAYGLAAAPFVGILFLFGIALGIFACAIVLRFGPPAEWLVWSIPAVLSPFAAVFYPLDVLPSWMRGCAQLFPPAYVFENLRAVVAGSPPDFTALFAALGLSVLYLLLACLCFARVYRHALRTGLIARYSAESIN